MNLKKHFFFLFFFSLSLLELNLQAAAPVGERETGVGGREGARENHRARCYREEKEAPFSFLGDHTIISTSEFISPLRYDHGDLNGLDSK